MYISILYICVTKSAVWSWNSCVFCLEKKYFGIVSDYWQFCDIVDSPVCVVQPFLACQFASGFCYCIHQHICRHQLCHLLLSWTNH